MPLPSPLPPNFVPCNAEEQSLVPDLKGLFHLPFDKENDGVKVAQAFVFPKGKALHVPTWPGKYVTAGEHAHVTVLCLVHFKSPVVPPALLTAFVDHEAADDRMKGVSVESVRLPLKLRVAADFQFWVKYNSWASCETCGFLQMRPLTSAGMQRALDAKIPAKDCRNCGAERPYTIPRPAEAPEALRGLGGREEGAGPVRPRAQGPDRRGDARAL